MLGSPFFGVLKSYSILQLQIRLTSTWITTTSEETVWQFISRSLKDIGCILGVLFTFVSIFFSNLLRCLLFSK
jgi:hypothetical protein